jgi:hypothetical protein
LYCLPDYARDHRKAEFRSFVCIENCRKRRSGAIIETAAKLTFGVRHSSGTAKKWWPIALPSLFISLLIRIFAIGASFL